MKLSPFMEAIFSQKIETGGGRHLRHSHLSRNADPEYFFIDAIDTLHESIICLLFNCLNILRSASNMECVILFEEKILLSLSFGRDPRRRWDILKQFS